MLELLALLRISLEFFISLGRTWKRRLVQPILTAACLIVAYAVIHISQERSLSAGLRAAFFDNDATKLERRRAQEQITLQAELHQFAAANRLIDQLLQSLLAQSNGAARVRLTVIHNGVSGLTGTGLLRYDVTNNVAGPGHTADIPVVNHPLTDWSDFLPHVLAGECSIHRVADLRSTALRAQYEIFGSAAILVCPVTDVQGKVLGASFTSWDGFDPVPTGEDLHRMMVAGKHIGAQIAAVLDLQGPPPWPKSEIVAVRRESLSVGED